jgi:HEPN domain-containing protein
VNRKDFQSLSSARLREAQVLFRSRHYNGAFYLAGYVVECALKAYIAKQTRRYDFPDKKTVTDSYTHDLSRLTVVAKLEAAFLQRSSQDKLFEANWNLIKTWSEESRYRTTNKADCRAFLDAIMEEQHGVLPWLKQLW